MNRFTFTIRHSDGRQYIIENKDDKSIWISDGTGEGGEFQDEELFKVIDKFYKENF